MPILPQKIRLGFFSLLLVQTCSTFALIQNPAVPFFKSPESIFKSGEESEEYLNSKLIGSEPNYRYFVSWDKHKRWVTGDSILTESRTLKSTQSADLGYAYNLATISLKQKPDYKSLTLVSLIKMSQLIVLGYEDEWLKVQYQNQTGFVHSSQIIQRADYAYAVLTDSGWASVMYRQNNEIILRDGKSISLNKIKSMVVRKNLGIITENLSEKSNSLVIGQHVKVLEIDSDNWFKSKIPDHGVVWWHKSKKSSPTNNDELILTTEEILQKPIYSMDFSKTNPNIGLVSAKGIYLTIDGKFWRKLKTFLDQDHLVQISGDSKLLVETKISHNLGKNFEPVFKWDIVTKQIEGYLGKNPKFLKLKELKTSTLGTPLFVIDTGYKTVQITTDKRMREYFIQTK